jgi:uncharacterized membrane protein
MHQIITFLKITLLGGALVVLPAWLAVLLLLHAFLQLKVFVKPVSTHLPESVGHPMVVATVLMVALCFFVGAIIRTAIGRRLRQSVELNLLDKVPGYTAIRRVAEQLSNLEENHGFKPALIEIDDALAPGFIVEEHADGRCTVFLPSSPAPAAGRILIIAAIRAHPVDVPVTKMFACITKWGTNSGELLAALASEKPS